MFPTFRWLIEAIQPLPSPNPIPERPMGWMDQSGKFYTLGISGTHNHWLLQHKLGQPSDVFVKKWIRIAYSRSGGMTTVYVHNPHHPPTTQQLRILKDAGIEHRWLSIYYDNDDRDVLLWSNIDHAY